MLSEVKLGMQQHLLNTHIADHQVQMRYRYDIKKEQHPLLNARASHSA
jgi:hypothetical protein